MIDLWKNSLEYVKKQKMRKLEKMFNWVKQEQTGVLFECPFCHYIGKNKRGTAKIFYDDGMKSMKCFSCGIWREL